MAKAVYRGANPPEGALLTVWIKEFTGDEIKIEITKVTGQPVANLKAPGAPGFTRLNWDLVPDFYCAAFAVIVGRLMTPDFIAVKEDWTVQHVLDYVREYGRDHIVLQLGDADVAEAINLTKN